MYTIELELVASSVSELDITALKSAVQSWLPAGIRTLDIVNVPPVAHIYISATSATVAQEAVMDAINDSGFLTTTSTAVDTTLLLNAGPRVTSSGIVFAPSPPPPPGSLDGSSAAMSATGKANGGAIAGGVLGGLACVLLVVLAFVKHRHGNLIPNIARLNIVQDQRKGTASAITAESTTTLSIANPPTSWPEDAEAPEADAKGIVADILFSAEVMEEPDPDTSSRV